MQAISYRQEEVGKFIKATKVKHTWLFILNSRPHTIDLRVSRLGGTIELKLDSIVVFKAVNVLKTDLSIPVKIDDEAVIVQQNKESYDLLFRGNRFDCYCQSQVPLKSQLSADHNFQLESRQSEGKIKGSSNFQAPQSSFYLPPSLANQSNRLSKPVPEIPLANTNIPPDLSKINDIPFDYSKPSERPSLPLQTPIPNQTPDRLPRNHNSALKPISQNLEPITPTQTQGYSPFDSFTLETDSVTKLPSKVKEEVIRNRITSDSRQQAQVPSRSISIAGRHFFETRGQYFLDTNFPKGTENIDQILGLIYRH